MHLTQGLHRATQTRPDAIATIMGARRRTWSDVRDRVARLAAGLKGLGLKRGDRVAAIALNSDRYIELYFAVAWAGGVIVPGNTRWAAPEHVFALQDSGAKILVVDKPFAALVAPLSQACGLTATIYMDDGDVPAGTIGFEDMIAKSKPMDDECGHDDELAALFYTGGTTGRSKGVMLSHRSIISNFLAAAATLPPKSNPIYLHSPPMFHLADASRVYGITMLAGTHVVVPFFSPEAVVKAIEAERVTEAVLVPTMFSMLWQYVAQNKADLTSLNNVTYGASPISETLLKQAMELFPKAEFAQAFGQTELSPGATILLPEFHKPSASGKSYLRSAGRAIVGMDIRIVDDTMTERPRGQVGEITVRGPGVMLGYWNQPDLTKKTIVDGWVKTGDAGYMDEEGFVYLVDRMKDMIVSGGENVYSAEVENALAAFPNLVECAVIGVPDPKWGERVHAILRLKDGTTASEAEVIEHCKRLIAGYKCPRSVEFRMAPLPMSAAGKILKVDIRKAYWPQGGRNIN